MPALLNVVVRTEARCQLKHCQSLAPRVFWVATTRHLDDWKGSWAFPRGLLAHSAPLWFYEKYPIVTTV
jgi:hypothetical protein